MGYRRAVLADVGAAAACQPVHVQGVCVWRESVGTQLLRLEIDDGTGVALVQVRGEAAATELKDLQAGAMVKALGGVQTAPLFASGRSWARWIDATSVSVVDDPNAESLHVLETLLLHQTVYVHQPWPSQPSSQTELAVSIPLLPLPCDAAADAHAPSVGEKRKYVDVVPQHPPSTPHKAPPRPTHQHHPQQQQPPTPSPSPSPSLLEMHGTQRRYVERQPSATATNSAGVPPAEYQFHVSGADLKLIATGAKTLEMRLNNPPYSIIRARDRLKFNGKLVTTVTAVRKYAELRSALEMEPLASLLPPAAPGAPGVSINGAVRRLRQFISETEEARHGVAVFEFAMPPGAATAARTPEQWSQLVFEFVGSKGSAGCSLRDLQFAFPALPVDTIEALLTDLQMDAVVYLAKGVYRLV